ncbi:hypothetical protein [Acidihalobacter yilgarnensis]|uniref:hypothetical protein n=1 Tax=Acidihalobacter yilgarnensis TaxID=2819280 RepID=UPI0012EA82F5|nr:hypothetical protein [Acidihalobacter yilgarnensis]
MIDWNEISAIATACAASFTAWMALLTRKAINQSRYALHQGKEQHMDNFRPVCVLEAYSDEHMDVTKRNQIVMVSRCDDNYHCVIKAHLITHKSVD